MTTTQPARAEYIFQVQTSIGLAQKFLAIGFGMKLGDSPPCGRKPSFLRWSSAAPAVVRGGSRASAPTAPRLSNSPTHRHRRVIGPGGVSLFNPATSGPSPALPGNRAGVWTTHPASTPANRRIGNPAPPRRSVEGILFPSAYDFPPLLCPHIHRSSCAEWQVRCAGLAETT